MRTIQDTRLWQDWHVRLILTHANGTARSRVAKFVKAFAAFIVELTLHRPDVVHLHSAAYGSFIRKSALAWTSTLFRVPVVWHMHGADFHIFHTNASRPLRFLIRLALERADAVIALGEAWADRLRTIAPKARIIVIPNAVRPGSPVNQRVEGPLNVAFLGEIGDRKGTFTLIDAWAKMLADTSGGTRALLTIAGDGEVDRARDQVAELGLGETVTVHGWMSSSDVAELIAGSQVLILPSRDEGQPMAILEAMARGLCVVATNVGGIPELLSDDCGLLVHPDDSDELAQAITYVLNDDEARESFGVKALQRIRDTFDVDVVSHRFDELYRQLADRER